MKNEEFPSIIVSTFGGEPQVLYAIALQANGRYVNVGRVPPHSPIGWPIKDAFDYDVESYAQLVKAFEAEDTGRLAELYAELQSRPRKFVETLTTLEQAAETVAE